MIRKYLPLLEIFLLIGLMPCAIAITEEGEGSRISVGDPALIGQVSQDEDLQNKIAAFQQQLFSLINQAAGVEALKAEKVKLYATASCPYCKMEESWLKSHNIDFEEVLVDLNQAEAENLVRRTGQMGVPVTEIIYNDGDPDVIIGFDKPRLASILNIPS